MAVIHNLGFPRIGGRRELKFALERYWRGESSLDDLEATALVLRQAHWSRQSGLDLVPVGDFSLYDHVLDMSFTLGNVPDRCLSPGGTATDAYFRLARGRSPADLDEQAIAAGEMTKWFDTNYHYIVPEFHEDTRYQLEASRLVSQVAEARGLGANPKPVIVGPVTYLWLGKTKDGTNKLDQLERLLPVYRQLLLELVGAGVEWVQVDEPVLVTELDKEWQSAFRAAYRSLAEVPVKLLLATYFGQLKENLTLLYDMPVQGVHLDAIRATDETENLVESLGEDQILSLGVIDGRNIWKSDLNALIERLSPLYDALGNRLWLAPSCSLLHVPVDLDCERNVDPEIRGWLAFACQKLEELKVLGTALEQGREAAAEALAENREAVQARCGSRRVHNTAVKTAVADVTPEVGRRQSGYESRARIQRERLQLPMFPTTTIGSFPQTPEIRKARSRSRNGELTQEQYIALMKAEIKRCVAEQEALGLDVLVHGEAERNDMVEYFGEQLGGFAFTEHGWVQSYGSRCVKPPIIYGDVTRTAPMTVEWSTYAASLTNKPMKGMLTGPVTILNWSFVRNDQPRSETCLQLALAIRREVLDLESAGIGIIQIDEPALREGLPLRKSEWRAYLDWAVAAFRVAANGVRDVTQIHTHMCYSEFNDIIQSITDLDADVITIETSRSDMDLLQAFDDHEYPNEIGPGVYDIHSPNVPSVESMVDLMGKAADRITPSRLWVNPDCGLKTRTWEEVLPALKNMVKAAERLRFLD